MYLGSNKQNQIRYHGRVGLDNRTINEIYTPLGAISPNGQIMPDFTVTKKPAANNSGSSVISKIDWNSIGKGIKTVSTGVLNYKIQMLNFKMQQDYLRQQQQIANAQNFQSFAAQNPVARQGVSYDAPPPVYTDNFDLGKYAPYLAGAGALLLLAIVMKRN